jgi:hypothetical protein
MPEPKEQKPRQEQKAAPAPVQDLPNTSVPAADEAAVKGGLLQRGGDDDLDDLEVER